MITPQEMRDIQFDKAVFGGYDMDAVDEFITNVTNDYTALYKENAVLKNKLKVLAETIEEYRSVDEAMRKALVTAQNMANDMVEDAKKKANDMIENASSVAENKITVLADRIRQEEERLKDAKHETAAFVAEIQKLYQEQNEMLQGLLPKVEVDPEDETSVEDTLTMATEQINQSVADAMSGIAELSAEAPEVPKPAVDRSGDTADLMIDEIEKQIADKPLEELGGQEKEKDMKVQVYEVDLTRGVTEADEDDDGDGAEEADASEHRRRGRKRAKDDLDDLDFDADATTKKFDLSDLKFGRNYDFNDDDE